MLFTSLTTVAFPKKVGFTRYLGLTKVGKNSLILT